MEEFPCYTLTSTPASIRCSFMTRMGTCDKAEVGTSILCQIKNTVYPIIYGYAKLITGKGKHKLNHNISINVEL
jgi:hypothetical protein